ncbi:hypothetical protein L3X38_017189 [Prunus dulcis]|uniref:Ubiquitin-like protease family profile domain-containing protein n=1 Tax=Prunus dulcis TaxID=3755 RepID=A0AAD4W7N6_PRUDU|nr:hypothetical protein L3X38_017189 [Prunus dulcis]
MRSSEKETRVVLLVKMVFQQQTKDSGSKKLGMVAPQDKSSKEMKSSKKMKFASSSAETEPTSQTTISDDSKSTGRGMSTMPRVVKRKLQKLRPIVDRHWILLIVRAKKETVYFLDPLLGHRVVDEEAKNIVNSAIKIYNTHIARAGRKNVIWKTLSGTPKQPSSVECGYYVMRFMRDIIMDPSLGFENKYAKGNQEASYPQEAIDEVRNEWAETVFQFIK